MLAPFRSRFLVLAAWLGAFIAFANSRAEHVFIISIDGGKPAVIQKSEMPVLDKIVAEGAHTWNAKTKHVRRGFTIQAPVVTYDAEATALWFLGAPHPKDMDGYPVVSAFE